HLTEEALAHPLDLARTVAVGARDRLGAGAGAAAPAVIARLGHLEGDRQRDAEDRLLERDRGGDLHVLAARRPARAASPAAAEPGGVAEQRAEQVVDAAAEHVVHRRATV